MKSILSLDQRCDVSRAVLFDERARLVASAERAVPTARPAPDREEQDAIGLACAMLDAAAEALETAGDRLSLAAIGVSVPRDALVVWDLATGEPVAPAIVGRDARAAATCRSLEMNFSTSISHRSALSVDPRFAAPRVAALLDEDLALRDRAERGELAFGTLDGWFVWTLSGGVDHRIGIANAAGTSLYDIDRHCWDERVGRIFGVPAAMQPMVVPTSGFIAMLATSDDALERVAPALREPLRRLLALVPAKTPILAATTEGSASLVGQRCIAPASAAATFEPGRTTVRYNTGPTPLRSRSSAWTSIAWHRPDPDKEPPDPFGDEFLLPEFPVETWDSSRGGWVTTMEVVVFKYPVVLPQDREYAYCLESCIDDDGERDDEALATRALAVCDAVARMQDDMAMTIGELRVDGDGAADDRAMQIQADLLGVPVRRPDSPLTSALGTALLAGLAARLWKSLDAAVRDAAAVETTRVFLPSLDVATRRERVLAYRAATAASHLRARH